MILVAIFSETGFFDYCAVKVGMMWHLIVMYQLILFPTITYLVSKTVLKQIF